MMLRREVKANSEWPPVLLASAPAHVTPQPQEMAILSESEQEWLSRLPPWRAAEAATRGRYVLADDGKPLGGAPYRWFRLDSPKRDVSLGMLARLGWRIGAVALRWLADLADELSTAPADPRTFRRLAGCGSSPPSGAYLVRTAEARAGSLLATGPGTASNVGLAANAVALPYRTTGPWPCGASRRIVGHASATCRRGTLERSIHWAGFQIRSRELSMTADNKRRAARIPLSNAVPCGSRDRERTTTVGRDLLVSGHGPCQLVGAIEGRRCVSLSEGGPVNAEAGRRAESSEKAERSVRSTRNVDTDAFRKVMGVFPTGVTVVTSGRGEKAEGMTANAVMSVSLHPLLVLVSVHSEARLNSCIKEHRYYAINILASDQEHLGRHFSSSDRVGGYPTIKALGGEVSATSETPLAAGALAWIECALERVYPGGDHDLFLGRVEDISANGERGGPLLYHRGDYLR